MTAAADFLKIGGAMPHFAEKIAKNKREFVAILSEKR